MAVSYTHLDVYKRQTSVCPLAKVMRRELKKRGIKKLKVVYSQELPVMPSQELSLIHIFSQYGKPSEIITHPENPFVKKFILNQLEIKRNNIYMLFANTMLSQQEVSA